MPKICAFGCPYTTPYHKFPHAEKNPERFKIWVQIVGGKLDSPEDYEFYRKKVVCDIHFTDKDRNRNNRLNYLAVPSLHLHGKRPQHAENIDICKSHFDHTYVKLSLKSGVPLHRFPNPKNPDQLERFRTWIIKIGNKIVGEDDNFIYKNRKVCHNHFESIYTFPNMRLTALAIPTLQISGALRASKHSIFEIPSTSALADTCCSSNTGNTIMTVLLRRIPLK